MRANQKYFFPLFDGAGKLLNRFLIVSNMRVADPINIVAGNARVVRPRLSDARFFFEQDRSRSSRPAPPKAGLGGLSQQARQPARASSALDRWPAIAATAAATSPRRTAPRAWPGRPRHRHGRRVPRAAGHHGTLLRAGRKARRGGRRRHRAALPAALRRRRAACRPISAAAVALADKLDSPGRLLRHRHRCPPATGPLRLRRAASACCASSWKRRRCQSESNRSIAVDRRRRPARLETAAAARPAAGLRVRAPEEPAARDGRDGAVIDAVLALRPRTHRLVPTARRGGGLPRSPEAEALAAANKRIVNILKKAENAGRATDDRAAAGSCREGAASTRWSRSRRWCAARRQRGLHRCAACARRTCAQRGPVLRRRHGMAEEP